MMKIPSEKWLEAQQAVLGSALIESALVPKLIQETRTTDFSGPCLTVYNAMLKVFQTGKPVDPVSVTHALGMEYRNYVLQLMEITPTAANFDHYLQICREQAKVVSVQEIGKQLAEAPSSEEMRKLLDKASAYMVDKSSLRITNISAALMSFMDRHSGEVKYLTWPVRELNERLYAEPGDFILIGGYPSAGKSAFGIQCARHWARSAKVGFFSLETSSEKLFDRLMSSITDLTMDDIKRNNISNAQWEQIGANNQSIVSLQLELIPASGMTVADIRSVTMMRGYDIIIIDYVQLVSASGGNRTEQVTNISLALHSMAQSMKVTVIGLSQLKRKNDSDDDAPESSDLRESGQLEQDADVIMTLKLKKKDEPEGNRWLYIVKNKEGTCPRIDLAFDGKHQTFTKAQATGSVVSKYVADGKRARRQNRKEAEHEQFTMLPDDFPVPFKERSESF